MENSYDRIERLLGNRRRAGEEDLLILHPDGTRSCIGWELAGSFHLTEPWKKEKRLTDLELLNSAYDKLRKRRDLFNGE